MIIVKDDHPGVGYKITPPDEILDSEGKPTTGPLTYVVASTDQAVLEVTPDADPTSGQVAFGAPGQATFQVSIEGPDGKVLGVLAEPFTVTAGDPASIHGGGVTFDGLTPV